MFDAYIRDHARLKPRALAFVTPDRRIPYARFDADIDRMGRALAALGIGPGSGVVSLRLMDGYATALATLALARLGVASSPSGDDRAELRLEDGDPGGPGPRGIRLTSQWLASALGAPHAPLPRLAPPPETVLRINLSSGTTRTPKRIALTSGRIAATSATQASAFGGDRLGTWMSLQGPDTAAGFIRPACAWFLGASFGAIPMPQLPEALETLPPGVLSAAPAQVQRLLRELPPGFRPQPQWRIVVGGAAMSRGLLVEARARLTPDLMINYGATETSVSCMGYADPDLPPGQVGFPLAGCEVQILGPDGRPVPQGEVGEVRLRTDRMSTEYLDDPERTAEVFRGGWFHPGDLGRLTPDGRLVIEGRTDDRMVIGSVKILPQAIEAPALECPGVVDCAAFAVPAVEGVDECWLAVVAEPGFDRDRLPAHLAAQPGLPPIRIAWTDDLPRTPSGKVSRTALRDAVLGALGGPR